MGRAAVLPGQPHRQAAADATPGHPAARPGSGDPRAHPGHGVAAFGAGDGQGHRRRPWHGGHRGALPLHRQVGPAGHRGRPRQRAPRQGGAARPGRAVALRRHADRRDRPPARGLQHHAVDAARHRPRHRAGGGTRVRPARAGGASLRDGAARPPGQPARAPERQGVVDAGRPAEPAQGRPAPLARDLRREAARLRHRGRGQPAGDAWRDAQLRSDLARQGPQRSTPARDEEGREDGSAGGTESQRGAQGLGPDCRCARDPRTWPKTATWHRRSTALSGGSRWCSGSWSRSGRRNQQSGRRRSERSHHGKSARGPRSSVDLAGRPRTTSQGSDCPTPERSASR